MIPFEFLELKSDFNHEQNKQLQFLTFEKI